MIDTARSAIVVRISRFQVVFVHDLLSFSERLVIVTTSSMSVCIWNCQKQRRGLNSRSVIATRRTTGGIHIVFRHGTTGCRCCRRAILRRQFILVVNRSVIVVFETLFLLSDVADVQKVCVNLQNWRVNGRGYEDSGRGIGLGASAAIALRDFHFD